MMLRTMLVASSAGAFWGFFLNALGAHPVVSLIVATIVATYIIITD